MIQNLDMRSRPDKTWREAIVAQLSNNAKMGRSQRVFADLVSRMLAWDSANRPTATEALQHPCMKELEDEVLSSPSHAQTKVSYTKKRSRLEKIDPTVD